MLELGIGGTVQLRNNALGQHFTEFHTPLVEGVDVPDRALREDAVFVERDQRADNSRSQLFREDQIGRPVAFAHAEGCLKIGRAFGLQLLCSFTESQSLCLRKKIRHQ